MEEASHLVLSWVSDMEAYHKNRAHATWTNLKETELEGSKPARDETPRSKLQTARFALIVGVGLILAQAQSLLTNEALQIGPQRTR